MVHTRHVMFQCLDAIKNGLSDTSLTPASRLSLIQRAHKILQSKGSRKRKSSKRDAMVMSDIQFLGAYSLKDFPEDDNRITEVLFVIIIIVNIISHMQDTRILWLYMYMHHTLVTVIYASHTP